MERAESERFFRKISFTIERGVSMVEFNIIMKTTQLKSQANYTSK